MNRFSFQFFLISGILCFSSPATAQQQDIRFERITTANGLSSVHVIAIALDVLNVPVVGFEAAAAVFGEAEICIAVDGGVVVVVEDDEVVESEVTGEGTGFRSDAFLQVTVTYDDVDVVIEDGELVAVEVSGEVFLCDGHSDGV